MATLGNRKGKEGERETIKELEAAFSHYGFKFFRSPSNEKSKRVHNGDINVLPSTDPKDLCVLKRYYIDNELGDRLHIIEKVKQGVEHCQKYAPTRMPLYIGRRTPLTRGGNHENPDPKIVSMRFGDFMKLILELQGFIIEEKPDTEKPWTPVGGDKVEKSVRKYSISRVIPTEKKIKTRTRTLIAGENIFQGAGFVVVLGRMYISSQDRGGRIDGKTELAVKKGDKVMVTYQE